MSEREPMDVDAAAGLLNDALRLQLRSAVSYTLVAGTLTGFEFAGLSRELAAFAGRELEDARRLVEKITSLGHEPTTDVAPVTFDPDPPGAVDRLVEGETEAIDALQAVIPSTGNEGRSEALEHRLEHIIMRKQEQVDALLRARGRAT